MSALHEVLRVAERGAHKVGRRFTNADDDWNPVLVAIDREGGAHTVAFPGEAMNSDVTKEFIAQSVLPDIIRERGLVACALVLSTWLSHEAAELGVRPSQAPDRREQVVICAVDATDTVVSTAVISRAGTRAPLLGRFKREAVGVDGFSMGGRFMDALVDTIRSGD